MNKISKVFFEEKEDGKRVIHTWVYSVLLIIAILSSVALIALTQASKQPVESHIDLTLKGTSHIQITQTAQMGFKSIIINQTGK